MLTIVLKNVPTSTGGTSKLRMFWKKDATKEWLEKINGFYGYKMQELGLDPCENLLSFLRKNVQGSLDLQGCGFSECDLEFGKDFVFLSIYGVKNESFYIDDNGSVSFNVGTKNSPYDIILNDNIFDYNQMIVTVTHTDAGRYDLYNFWLFTEPLENVKIVNYAIPLFDEFREINTVEMDK